MTESESAGTDRDTGQPDRPVLVAHPGYLEVRLSVQRTCPRNHEGCLRLIAPLVHEHGARRLLLVCTDPTDTLDRVAAYWTGEAIARLLASVRVAIAVIRRPIDYLEDFAAIVARQRGSDVRYFDNLDEAVRWLRQP